MQTVRILTVIGTRPEAIKLAPVIMELQRQPAIVSKVCFTGQHRQLLNQAVEPFGIRADADLDIMTDGQSLAQVTARAIEGLDRVIEQEKPDLVLVQGDTTTAFCGALVAYYRQVRVGHVEAGLRSGNRFAPFPEEVNRRLVAQATDFHFAPTARARDALLREGFDSKMVFVTGNTVIDALLFMRDKVRGRRPDLPDHVIDAIPGRKLVLVTGHRRESFASGFENICRAILSVVDIVQDALFIYPVHLNPHVREPVNRILGNHERVLLIEPVSYGAFVWLMDQAAIILTDSGGVQEEAPSLGKPVLVMRETTERPEGIEAGNARLVGVQEDRIAASLLLLLRSAQERQAMSTVANPYGDGKAAQRICSIVLQHLLH
jgi:UDP-N-acetylglucosamine 2-epimerase (non-hydrolysing)